MIYLRVLQLTCMFWLRVWKTALLNDLQRYARYRAELAHDQRRLYPDLNGLKLLNYQHNLDDLERVTHDQLGRAEILKRCNYLQFNRAELSAVANMLKALALQNRTKKIIEMPDVLKRLVTA